MKVRRNNSISAAPAGNNPEPSLSSDVGIQGLGLWDLGLVFEVSSQT